MRIISTLTVFVAMVLSVVATSAVFSDWNWFVPTVAVVFLTVATGWLSRLSETARNTGLTVIVQFVVGFFAVIAVTLPETTVAGVIPTGSSFSELAGSIAQGFRDVYAAPAPAPSTAGLTVLATVSFALLTMLVDSLVHDLHLTHIAGALVLATWLIPVFIAASSIQWWHTCSVAVAFILLLLTAHTGASRGFLWAVTAGALALILGIGLPLLMPPIVPQANKPAGEDQDVKVINPFLDLRANLTNKSDDVVFSYESTDPLEPPVRLTSVSEFDGKKWAPAAFSFKRGASPDAGLPVGDLGPDIEANSYTSTFTIKGLGGNHLPAQYAPLETSGLGDRWVYDRDTLTIVGNNVGVEGLNYSLTYRSVEPTAEQLKKAPPVNEGAFEQYLKLPNDLPSDIKEEADAITKDAKTDWDKAAKLQAHFRDFEYSLDAPNEASGSVLSQFLKDRRGYCVQFSAAMATMARMEGIPARIGVGFTAGEPNDAGGYDVTMQRSHAWPELYFEGAGWVRFEPTPGGPAGPPPPWSVEGGEAPEEPEEPTQEPSEEPAPEEEAAEPTPTPEEEPAQEEESETTSAVPFIVGAAVFALVILALLPLLLRARARSRRLRTPLNANLVWEEIRATEVDCGYAAPASDTLAKRGRDLSEQYPDHADDIAKLVGTLEREHYAGTGSESLDIDARGLVKDVKKDRAGSAFGRVKATLWPRSLWKKK
ncbi:hypothetical protein JOE56_001914 [Brevibacterium paucivorans]|uniref:Transglutaminase-like domain-containing protein n=1 Tax=Brevibacterium paucivorans TaxID=170994 RepID=A0ABS2SLT0_9MICO|nr:DUF3488 and transglutaminase-like domain-containing protein [Brevibacterium paucivorans]MBM7817220.1 hypothetical protein [Brevibacterium paucivorans]